ncbi:MAG: hypothetical protein ACKPKO_42660, partial [Candidatus Fonsibacter sp.]
SEEIDEEGLDDGALRPGEGASEVQRWQNAARSDCQYCSHVSKTVCGAACCLKEIDELGGPEK